MALQITCDGCGKRVDTTTEPNYWKATLMGDVTMSAGGKILDTTGMKQYIGRKMHYVNEPIRQADVCVSCMSKTQEGAE